MSHLLIDEARSVGSARMVDIAWETSGAGAPLVLVHGLSEDRRAWQPLLPALEQSFEVLRLDLRGHGESGLAADYGALAMAADVATAVAESGLQGPPLVVGHSLGAIVATAYALQSPVRAVVNIDQSLRLGDFASALAPLEGALRGPEFLETFAAIVDFLGHDGVPDEQLAYLQACHRTASQEVVLGVWGDVFASSPDDLTALGAATIAGISVPYVAIHGSDPGDGYPAWLTAACPTARVEVWRGGHYPHLVEPGRFAALLVSLADA